MQAKTKDIYSTQIRFKSRNNNYKDCQRDKKKTWSEKKLENLKIIIRKTVIKKTKKIEILIII